MNKSIHFDVTLSSEHNTKLIFLVDTYNGTNLYFWRLDRKQMGAYLCIASNDVPPAVSKRISLNVNCKYFYIPKLIFSFVKKYFYITMYLLRSTLLAVLCIYVYYTFKFYTCMALVISFLFPSNTT